MGLATLRRQGSRCSFTAMPTHQHTLRRATATLLACLPLVAGAQVLYDPARDASPQAGGWLDGMFLGLNTSSDVQGTTVTPATGTGNGAYGGYANHQATVTLFPELQVGTGAVVNADFPVLDRMTGYSLRIGLQLLAENHSGNSNRAGFSITLIGDDLLGVEIGFQHDRIFAQGNDPLFAAAESTQDSGVLSALASPGQWALSVQGDGYRLSLGGATVLSGLLRDYSAYTGLGQEAYRTPNFLFVGDNTSSASASFRLTSLAVAVSPVPEPAQAALLLAGLGVVAGVARRHRR